MIARFEAERQALAMMDHPNIARVLDAGATDSGRPYFVMELVHGVPITQYCDEARLTLAERLELFIPVCQAIQHAHQKGIIHRDIKPSNVLVTLYDGKPVPKVIDFGIAKATDQRLTERTMFTEFGSIVGTLEYMSPEQAEMSAMGVDTRSDIYSLGVLLYELMTGSTPLERARLNKAGYVEILRRIKEEETPRPSTRLSDSGDALAAISARRKTEAAKLTKLMRGELDWIVMKALEKDRTRRYETASGFARDIRNYPRRRPGRSLPALGRLSAAEVRPQAPAGAGGRLGLRGAPGPGGRAEHLAGDPGHAGRGPGQDREREGQALRRRVAGRPDVLPGPGAGGRPARGPGRGAGQGRDHPQGGRRRRAEDRRGVQGPADRRGVRPGCPGDHLPATWANRRWRSGSSTRSLELRTAGLGSDHPDTLSAQNDLALAYRDAGRWDRAIPLFERDPGGRDGQLGPDHPDTLLTQNNLALAYRDDGQWDRAIPLFERTLAARTARLGPDHPDTLLTQHNLAMAYREAGRLDRAIALFERTLAAQTARLGADHPITLLTQNNLARPTRRWPADRAIALLERTLAARRPSSAPTTRARSSPRTTSPSPMTRPATSPVPNRCSGRSWSSARRGVAPGILMWPRRWEISVGISSARRDTSRQRPTCERPW